MSSIRKFEQRCENHFNVDYVLAESRSMHLVRAKTSILIARWLRASCDRIAVGVSESTHARDCRVAGCAFRPFHGCVVVLVAIDSA